MLDELAVFLGGRVAEELMCDDITSGASNDLERATEIGRTDGHAPGHQRGTGYASVW